MRLGLICSLYVPPTPSQSQAREIRPNRSTFRPALAQKTPMSFVRAGVPGLFPAALRSRIRAARPRPDAGDADWLYRGSDIARDPAWRFGTLPNGLRYAVRRNALPAGQVSIRVRIDAGSLHEADNERGWAHFLEHMLFRGTHNYPDRRAREIWQQLGASFGSDSNARTDATNTVYVLNLPHAAREPLDTSLAVLAEMMAGARIEPAAVDGRAAGRARREGAAARARRAHHRAQPAPLLRRPALRASATRSAPTRR